MDRRDTHNYGNIKLMFDSMPYPCHLWNRNFQMLDCNDASMQLFKIDNKDDFKDRFTDFSPEYQPDGALSIKQASKHLIKAFSVGKWVFDWVHKASDGTPIPCKVTLIRVDGKTEQLVVAHIIDMTEHNMMTVKLKEALGKAQDASHAKSIFLSNMSHEIRTPMNAIIGMGEILAREPLNERQQGYVSDIVVSSKSLLDIINDILDFSKIESGKLELNPVDYDFNALINNIESLFVFIAQKKGIDFILECGDGIPGFLYGDDIRLRQVLINICGNAVKFTDSGYVKLRVNASQGFLNIDIVDTGVGIRKEDMPKLFTAFEQVDKSINRSVVGTGLGLPLSKSFVELMGGRINIKSDYGRGSEFTITIPIVEGNAENVRIYESGGVEKAFSAPGASVLVTDDNEFNLKVASGLLSLMDIEAETADSGLKAIELIKQKDYDIIFMDHMMPEMDGVETVHEIRKMGGKYLKLPIVALTANAIGNAREMFIENGFNEFISKPIEVSKLYETVEKLLPPEMIRTQAAGGVKQARMGREETLRRKSAVTFVKENLDTYERMTASLETGDIKTAHRMAHTIKSSAGYLGRKELQEAAFSIEESLQDGKAGCSPDQLAVFKTELENALSEFMPLYNEAQAEKKTAVEIGGDALETLLSELEPLLRKSDFAAADFAEKLLGIEGMEKLAQRIDDYDFEGALAELELIQK